MIEPEKVDSDEGMTIMRWWYVGRLSAALTLLTLSLVFLANGFGFVPDADQLAIQSRSSLAKSLGVEAVAAVQANDPAQFEAALSKVLAENPDLLSAGLREPSGFLAAGVGDHIANWVDPGERTTASSIWLAIEIDGRPWGRVEFAFRPSASRFLGRFWPGGSVGQLTAFLGVACFGVFGLYLWYMLGRMLAEADTGIPSRVRQALDALAEGVVILDHKQQIAHTNQAFNRMAGFEEKELVGRRIGDLGWSPPPSVGATDLVMPWDLAKNAPATRLRVPVLLKGALDTSRLLSVNATPIVGGDGRRKGTLATFDDLTELEQKNTSLHEILKKLKTSRAEIHRQNQELKLLATRDSLTLCLNRRAFFGELNPVYEQAARTGAALSCVMIDVDRFKQINDRHGHAAGDHVLSKVAELLRQKSRNTDLVCRYGGEEFAILLPQTDLESAAVIADRIRESIAEKPFAGVPVTASFGISSLSMGPNGPQGLMDQADQAMYAAKRRGRNRVARFDELDRGGDSGCSAPAAEPVAVPPRTESAIPYPAVTALISALAYRDALTAEHSRRVATLCVRLGHDLLSQSDAYLLEVAALLHDIGKLGVPDAVLFKPGALTEDEWKVMRLHDRMGLEIITAAFASDALTRIVATHHAWYAGSPRDSSLPVGDAIPLPGRMLALADAYDSMVSDRLYRKGRSRDEAIAELRRCSGTQFDPELVERFIDVVRAVDPPLADPMSDVSKESALLIGTQIERLASAIDEHDVPALATMATQLAATARECEIPAIVEAANRLEQATTGTTDWITVLEVTHDLLELCRSTQSIYLRDTRLVDLVQRARATVPAESQRSTDSLVDTLSGTALGTHAEVFFPPFPEMASSDPSTETIHVATVNEPLESPTEILKSPFGPPRTTRQPRPLIVTLH